MKSLHLNVYPVKSIEGEITVPGDKSISHRAVIFGSIAEGISTVKNFSFANDCLATVKALQTMGVNIKNNGNLHIYGVGKNGLKKANSSIDCENSGTTMRLLTGLLSAMPFDSHLIGDKSLVKRPMLRISEPLNAMGAQVFTTKGKAPLTIQGNKKLYGINYIFPTPSAQVKSCLLLAALFAEGKTQLTELQPTRDHSEKILSAFSYPYQKEDNVITINSQFTLKACDLTIPGDLSSAAFFIVAATLLPNSLLRIKNVGVNLGRIGILTVLKKMGANITLENHQTFGEEPVADIVVRSAPLTGISILADYIPLLIDELPVLFIAASCAQGKTTIKGASELRVKESDRLFAMTKGLQSLGVRVKATDDGAVIQGGFINKGVVDSFHDHRVAMAFAIAGTVAKGEVTIKNCDNIATSFPSFISTAHSLQLSIKEYYA